MLSVLDNFDVYGIPSVRFTFFPSLFFTGSGAGKDTGVPFFPSFLSFFPFTLPPFFSGGRLLPQGAAGIYK
jgi:hypothetical protein